MQDQLIKHLLPEVTTLHPLARKGCWMQASREDRQPDSEGHGDAHLKFRG